MKVDLNIDEKYEEILVSIKARKLDDEVLEIIKKLKEQKTQKFIGKKNDKIYIIKLNKIVCFYSEKQRIFIDTETETFETKMKLYEIENLLDGTNFVRISKFAIVNIEKINNIELSLVGTLVINLFNGKKEFISRRFVKKVKDFIGMEVNK